MAKGKKKSEKVYVCIVEDGSHDNHVHVTDSHVSTAQSSQSSSSASSHSLSLSWTYTLRWSRALLSAPPIPDI